VPPCTRVGVGGRIPADLVRKHHPADLELDTELAGQRLAKLKLKAAAIAGLGGEGKRIRTEHLELRVVASLLHHSRIGLVVPKHGRSIVERNQLKRRLREIVRLNILKRIDSVDMIVRARPEAYSATFASLERELITGRERTERLFKAR